MDTYNQSSQHLSRQLTNDFSSSFGLSCRLLDDDIRADIYNIYGLVRIADEIVDSYTGHDAGNLLNELEAETTRARATGFSTNPIVQAFTISARAYSISPTLIAAFFNSMRQDLTKTHYSLKEYTTYIYGSAEVIGLMCLIVFVRGDTAAYERLKASANHLGAGYQKVNFLRDIASDYHDRGRFYFPGCTFQSFNETNKTAIIADINADFAIARTGVAALPPRARSAVQLSLAYYSRLTTLLARTPVSTLKTERVRLSSSRKAWLFLGIGIRRIIRA